MLVVGVDENGLGPRLGPLVVTAVTVEAEGEKAAKVALGRPGRSFATRINDSKKLVSYKERALGEAWARVLADRLGRPTSTPAELVFSLSLEPEAYLREPCPTEGDHAHQCFSTADEAYEADADLLGQVRSDLGRLEKRGLRLVSVQSALVCTRRLNDAAAKNVTRFQVDLHAMERLVLDARARGEEDVVAVCGKVGGYNTYGDAFGPLSGRLHAIVCEGRAKSEYQMPGLGRLSFVRDADAKHLVVCLASLVGKYVRDLLTARVVRHHKRTLPHLPMVSGYHDRVTNAFVKETEPARLAAKFPDECFERRAVPGDDDDDEPNVLEVDDLAPTSLVDPASRV